MLAPQKNQNPTWSNFGDRRVLNLQYNCLAVQAAASPRRRLKEKVSEIVRSNGHIITIKIGVAGYNILKSLLRAIGVLSHKKQQTELEFY